MGNAAVIDVREIADKKMDTYKEAMVLRRQRLQKEAEKRAREQQAKDNEQK
jgi:heme exporter protein D